MQPRQFNMLAIGAVISLIAAGVVHSSYNSFDEETVSGKRLFPLLESQADATGHIAIVKGEEKLTLKKSADGKVWSLLERAGYPVDPKKVSELVIKLGQTELIERKTKNEKLYSELDLGDPKAKSASAKLIRLGDKDNKTIAEVVIGRERRAAFGAGKSGTYVRVPGDAQTWLAKLELNASTEVADWVKPVFFRFDQDKMASIEVKKGDKLVYRLGRAEKKKDEKLGAYKIVDVPAGQKVKKGLRVNDIVNGIRTLEMVDVREARAADGKPDMTALITMIDGAKYRVGMKAEDKKRWMTVAVVANGKDEAASKKLAEATKGWAFEIAEWRSKQTFKEAKDVFEVVKAEAPKAAPNAPLKPPAGLGPRISRPAFPPRKAAPETTAPTNGRPPEPADAALPKK